jgi:hypothetical protein
MMKNAPPDKEDVLPTIRAWTPERLERSQEPEEILLLLRQFGLTTEDIAQGTGADVRTVRRWNNKPPGKSAAIRLGEIRNIVVRLKSKQILSDRGIIFWLRHPNRLLDDYSPLSVIGAGGFRSALEAAKCFIQSERGFHRPLSDKVLRRLESKESSRSARVTASGKKLEPVGS